MADNEQQENTQQFALQRLYVKDLSFESPQSPSVFTKQWQPKVKVDLNTKSDKIDEDLFEVVVTVTITTTVEDETAFLVEVQQAGLFLIKGLEGEQLRQVLAIMCPNLLFPYAREAVDNLVIKGSFPPVALQPVNFEALYAQAVKQAQEQQAQESAH